MKRPLKAVTTTAAAVVLLLVMLYMSGTFRTGVIGPQDQIASEPSKPAPERVTSAVREWIPQWYEAVGTVQSRREATLSARINGRVLQVLADSGESVRAGAVLLELDRRDLAARLAQAEEGVTQARAERKRALQALKAARAGLAEALAHFRRTRSYYRQEAATEQQLEQAESRYRQAEAGMHQAEEAVAAAQAVLKQAQQSVAEAEIALGYGLIRAPYDGRVTNRLVDPGDQAWPGKPLITLQQPDSLRFEAGVREGLINRIQPGTSLTVQVDAVGLELAGKVEELVPAADVSSRTFLVRVGIPAGPGLYPGMFGRLRVPLGKRRAVLVPKNAIRRIGQLELVTAQVQDHWLDLYVTTGATYDDRIEVLSGLDGTERIALE